MIDDFFIVLNFSCFQDSMATNEIQLLRLCIHLLLMAGIDLSTVRKSGKVNSFSYIALRIYF